MGFGKRGPHNPVLTAPRLWPPAVVARPGLAAQAAAARAPRRRRAGWRARRLIPPQASARNGWRNRGSISGACPRVIQRWARGRTLKVGAPPGPASPDETARSLLRTLSFSLRKIASSSPTGRDPRDSTLNFTQPNVATASSRPRNLFSTSTVAQLLQASEHKQPCPRRRTPYRIVAATPSNHISSASANIRPRKRIRRTKPPRKRTDWYRGAAPVPNRSPARALRPSAAGTRAPRNAETAGRRHPPTRSAAAGSRQASAGAGAAVPSARKASTRPKGGRHIAAEVPPYRRGGTGRAPSPG